MYDETEHGAIEDPSADSALAQLKRLEWTSHGYACWAEFHDPNDLRGKDLKALRVAAGRSENGGESTHDVYTQTLTTLVRAWEIGYAPTLSVPADARHPSAILEQLYAVDLRRLELHVKDTMLALVRGDEGDGLPEEGFGSPRTPARG